MHRTSMSTCSIYASVRGRGQSDYLGKPWCPTISRRLRSKSSDNSGKQQERRPDILHSSATSILPGGTGGAATPCHSVRSEIAGSTSAARRAGSRRESLIRIKNIGDGFPLSVLFFPYHYILTWCCRGSSIASIHL